MATLERADLDDQVYASLKEGLATRKLAPWRASEPEAARRGVRRLAQSGRACLDPARSPQASSLSSRTTAVS
jgi:hypothetical protein